MEGGPEAWIAAYNNGNDSGFCVLCLYMSLQKLLDMEYGRRNLGCMRVDDPLAVVFPKLVGDQILWHETFLTSHATECVRGLITQSNTLRPETQQKVNAPPASLHSLHLCVCVCV